jgi:hypothetical protein
LKRAEIPVLVLHPDFCYGIIGGLIIHWQQFCSPEIMNFVEPIRDRKKIAQIKNLLRGQSRYRDLLLFGVGINTAHG